MPIARDTAVTPTITASGTTWTQYKAGGLAAVIANLITANAAKVNPAAALTTAVTSATGGLGAGSYFASYTNCDAFGETTPGSSECASAFTVTGTTQLCTLTVPALPTGVQSRNIYLTPVAGVSGTEVLYLTGVTATAVTLDVALTVNMPGTMGYPTTNTTGAAAHSQRICSILRCAATEGSLSRLSEDLSSHLHGDPTSRQEFVRKHTAWVGITKLWYTALSEIATLLAANMPTASTSTANPVGIPQNKWTMP